MAANLGRAIVTNRDFTTLVSDSAATRPSSQITLRKLVLSSRRMSQTNRRRLLNRSSQWSDIQVVHFGADVISEGDRLETGVWFSDDQPEELTPRRGSELVLNCSVSTSGEFAPANVTWLKDGQRLAAELERGRVRLGGPDGSLVIRRVQARTDNGYYQCLAAVQGLGVILSPPTRLHVAGRVSFTASSSQGFCLKIRAAVR